MIEQIDDADADAGVFIDVRRSDALAGRADFTRALFGDGIEQFVVRHDEMRMMADEQPPARLHAGGAQHRNLLQKRGGINHHAVADDARDARVENAGRD